MIPLDMSDLIPLTLRVVLRSQGLIPTRKLVRLHHLHKDASHEASSTWAFLRTCMERRTASTYFQTCRMRFEKFGERLLPEMRHMIRTYHEE